MPAKPIKARNVTPQHDFWKLPSMKTPCEITFTGKPSPDRFLTPDLLKSEGLRNCKKGKREALIAKQVCSRRMDAINYKGLGRFALDGGRISLASFWANILKVVNSHCGQMGRRDNAARDQATGDSPL